MVALDPGSGPPASTGVPFLQMTNTATIALAVVGLILSAITIFAIYYGPIKALKVQRELDAEREARSRKLSIYKTLMSNRATRLSPLYVQALNLIEIEFTGEDDNEKHVRRTWRELLDLYESYKTTPNAFEKVTELTATMLESMGKCLGYDFDRVTIKKGVYYPEMHGDIEKDNHTLRKNLLELLDGTGRRKLPVAFFETGFPDVKLPEGKKPKS
jgi:hypothetical protein